MLPLVALTFQVSTILFVDTSCYCPRNFSSTSLRSFHKFFFLQYLRLLPRFVFFFLIQVEGLYSLRWKFLAGFKCLILIITVNPRVTQRQFAESHMVHTSRERPLSAWELVDRFFHSRKDHLPEWKSTAFDGNSPNLNWHEWWRKLMP